MMDLIRLSLEKSDDLKIALSQQDYDEMKKHALIALPAPVLSKLSISSDLYEKWKKDIFQQVAYYVNYKLIQEQLPIKTPYVILKGISAAKYYPHPEYRTMGDIDIMTCHEDYETACVQLLENSWKETTNPGERERGRHRSFQKNGFIVEVHSFFASMNDPKKAKILDDYIIENITDSHILPDMVNGLVLIDHVNQHLEEGIGLRQIIDWMMFVDKCIRSDKEWSQFKELAQKTGLKKLAMTTTRMCEIYLGLSKHDWCANVDKKLCHELMNYVMQSGNFGSKREKSETLAINRMEKLRHPIRMIKELQRQGMKDWKGANNHFFSRFAWIWKGFQLLRDTPNHKDSYIKAKKLNTMFNALGIKRNEKGLVYYINGEYVKKI